MIIQHNLPALNAYRNKRNNRNAIAMNLEKLSSGYKINRAGDDAAGLAISEKMRAQVAGLARGEKNISDGISLVQTAEGAMAEMCDMMHRLTNLTIQSYNGTYSRTDRQMMQQEVEQILREMDRITESTNFNGITLLQGDPVTEIVVEESKTYTQIVKQTIVKGLPDWVHADSELTDNHSYSGTQDMNGVMFQFNVNNTLTNVYYGSKDEGIITRDGIDYEYGGPWTSDIANNAAAKIGFEGLVTESKSAVSLYNNLFELIGCSIGVPCGSCSDKYYSIAFVGSENGVTASAGNFYGTNIVPEGELNLSEWKGFRDKQGNAVNCFDYVKELIVKHQDPNISDADAELQTEIMAKDIAKALRNKVQQTLENVTGIQDHFDRSFMSGDYDIIVYDYRDTDKLANRKAADAEVKTKGYAFMEIPVEYFDPGKTVLAENPIEIVCSSYPDDIIPIELPDVSIDALGLTGYSVADYEEIFHYSDTYLHDLEQWEENPQYITKQETVTYDVITMIKPAITADVLINGEEKRVTLQEAQYKTETKSETRTYSVRDPNHPKPAPGSGDVWMDEEYVRADIKRLEDALAKIVSYRGTLGAAQNRLEHALNATGNYKENLVASESRLRDVDMAKEMMAFTKNNIISEAASAMLSHANMIPQGVLQLLK